MLNRYMWDIGHLRSHHWKYWLDVYNNCGFDCKYCVYRTSEKMGKITRSLPSLTEFRSRLTALQPDGILYLGPKADVYQPKDNATQFTREIVGLLSDLRWPTIIVTRSTLVLRDIDIMQDMSSRGLIEVSITIASAKENEALEPNTPTVNDRISLISALKRAGIQVSVHMSPIIPMVDTYEELAELMRRCADAGADCIYACVLGMSEGNAGLIQKAIEQHYPHIDVRSAYRHASSDREVYSADTDYIITIMGQLRDYAECHAIPFACAHLPEFDTIQRSGSIFRFKVPTVGDICRHFVRRGIDHIQYSDLEVYLKQFSAVDADIQDSIRRFWVEGMLFKNTYFHPIVEGGNVTEYVRVGKLDLNITNMKVTESASHRDG